MPNPYYGHTSGQPISLSRAASSAIRAEFDLVQAGFDAVNTAIALGVATATSNYNALNVAKGAITGQAWTGAHAFGGSITVPTLTYGATGANAASVDYVNAAAFAAANLPAQTANDGKALYTRNGLPYWGYANLNRSARTTNTTLVTADQTKWIDITAGTFTQTFDAVATLGNGWSCYIRNSGTGDITLDPSGAELIDGLSSYIMYPGEARVIMCDGVALYSCVLTPFSKTFTATGAFTKPPGYAQFSGLIWGGGASGSKGDSSGGRGGAGGGCGNFTLPSSSLGATTTVTIGAGGAAVTTASTAGVAGGTTSLGAVLSSSQYSYNVGGSVVAGAADSGASYWSDYGGNAGNGAGPGGSFFGGAAPGPSVVTYNGASACIGGSSWYGGAAGGSYTFETNTSTLYIGSGGASTFGGNGGAAGSTTSGVNGTAPAGGGGGTGTGASSGAGARGELRIWGVA